MSSIKKCPKCGRAGNENYCPNCGGKLLSDREAFVAARKKMERDFRKEHRLDIPAKSPEKSHYYYAEAADIALTAAEQRLAQNSHLNMRNLEHFSDFSSHYWGVLQKMPACADEIYKQLVKVITDFTVDELLKEE